MLLTWERNDETPLLNNIEIDDVTEDVSKEDTSPTNNENSDERYPKRIRNKPERLDYVTSADT